MIKGNVVEWYGDKNYGIVAADGEEFFVHHNGFRTLTIFLENVSFFNNTPKECFQSPREGDAVVFEVREQNHGKRRLAKPWNYQSKYIELKEKLDARKKENMKEALCSSSSKSRRNLSRTTSCN